MVIESILVPSSIESSHAQSIQDDFISAINISCISILFLFSSNQRFPEHGHKNYHKACRHCLAHGKAEYGSDHEENSCNSNTDLESPQ